jgi:hypothetical protein
MSLLLLGSLALTLSLLLGTFLITHGHMRGGFLYLACLQIPAGAYDVATGQYGFVLMSLIGGALYLRGWLRAEAGGPENPPVLRRAAHHSQSFAGRGTPGILIHDRPGGPAVSCSMLRPSLTFTPHRAPQQHASHRGFARIPVLSARLVTWSKPSRNSTETVLHR